MNRRQALKGIGTLASGIVASAVLDRLPQPVERDGGLLLPPGVTVEYIGSYIVLRFNSPGGEAKDVSHLYELICKGRIEKIPQEV
jgi:hypothetical protein